MKRRSILIFSAVFLLITGCLAGCQTEKTEKVITEQNQADAAEDVQEMVVAVNVDSSTEELPFSSVLLNRSQFWGGLVFQGLLVSNDNINNVEKDLCEDYTISPDGITYVFVLKDDVYWHDGE